MISAEFFKLLTKEERAASSFYSTYTITFLICNWRILYFLIFEKTENNKLNTLGNYLFWSSKPEWLPQMAFDLWNFIWIFGLPVIFALLVIRYLPALHNRVYSIDMENFFIRKLSATKERLHYERQKAEYEKGITLNKKEVLKELQAQKEVEGDIQRTLTDEEKWDNEYLVLKSNATFKNKFSQIVNCIYDNNGRFYFSNGQKIVEADILAICHSRNIIQFKESDNDYIILTEKGKYIVALYSQELKEIYE